MFLHMYKILTYAMLNFCRKMRSNREMDCSRAGIENCLAVAEAAAEASAANEVEDIPMMTKKNYIMLR